MTIMEKPVPVENTPSYWLGWMDGVAEANLKLIDELLKLLVEPSDSPDWNKHEIRMARYHVEEAHRRLTESREACQKALGR